MKKTAIIFFAFFICNIATAQEVPKIRIDPSKAYGGSVSEYFDSVEYIPLETTKESLFGDIEQMIVTDSSYVISDFDTKSILFFFLSGQYIIKYHFNQNKYIKIYEDKTGGNIIASIYDPYTLRVETLYYSTTGRFLYKNGSNFRTFLSPPIMIPLGNNYYVQGTNCFFRRGQKPIDSVFHLVDIYHLDTLIKSMIPFNQLTNAGFCALNGYIELGQKVRGESLLAATPLEHIIYSINKDTAIPIYKIILPADRTVPDNILYSYNSRKIDSIYRDMETNSSLVSTLSNIFFHRSQLFFKLNLRVYTYNINSDPKTQYNIIYDTLTNRLVSLERITPDISTYLLPILDFGTSMRGVEYGNGFLYSTVSSLQMFTAREKTKSKNPQYPPALQQYFKTQNRKSNPVIVKMKLRE